MPYMNPDTTEDFETVEVTEDAFANMTPRNGEDDWDDEEDEKETK